MISPGESGTPESRPARPVPARKDSVVGGVILLVLGLLFLARNLIPGFDFSDYWPLLLIVLGVALIWRSPKS